MAGADKTRWGSTILLARCDLATLLVVLSIANTIIGAALSASWCWAVAQLHVPQPPAAGTAGLLILLFVTAAGGGTLAIAAIVSCTTRWRRSLVLLGVAMLGWAGTYIAAAAIGSSKWGWSLPLWPLLAGILTIWATVGLIAIMTATRRWVAIASLLGLGFAFFAPTIASLPALLYASRPSWLARNGMRSPVPLTRIIPCRVAGHATPQRWGDLSFALPPDMRLTGSLAIDRADDEAQFSQDGALELPSSRKPVIFQLRYLTALFGSHGLVEVR